MEAVKGSEGSSYVGAGDTSRCYIPHPIFKPKNEVAPRHGVESV